MMDLSVAALMHISHAALPHLLRAADTGERRVADLVNISSVAGRVARVGAGAYNATKFAVGAFSEALRQKVTRRHVRVSLVEPGYVATELQSHNRPEILEALNKRYQLEETLQPDEIADAVRYIVTRRRNVAINELLIRPTEQEG
jgi:NADP-dependent 3-hydroxy acid dehydrogenase YdfG